MLYLRFTLTFVIETLVREAIVVETPLEVALGWVPQFFLAPWTWKRFLSAWLLDADAPTAGGDFTVC